MNTLIYGLFDQKARISDHLNLKNSGITSSGSIHSDGYLSIKHEGIEIYIHCRLYNIDELSSFTGITATNIPLQILSLYKLEGTSGFRRLNGKFTIIIREPGLTTIVRDRNGADRVIYFTSNFFTDSFQRLFDFKEFIVAPDFTGITTFLNIGYIPSPVTSLEGVRKVPAGEILYVTKNGYYFGKLFDFPEIDLAERKDLILEDALREYCSILKNAIRRRTGNSEKVGVLLSGGYDSGGNIAMLREVFHGKIQTFSIGFSGNCASELPFARMIAEKYDAEHHEYIMNGSELDNLPQMVDILGDPFSESGFMLNYSVMNMIGQEPPPVVLGGEANDQYFGAGIRETAIHYKIHRLGMISVLKLFDQLSDRSLFDRDNLAFRIHYQNHKILKVMEPECFGFHRFHLQKMFDMKNIPEHPYLNDLPVSFSSYEDLFLQRNYYLHLKQTTNDVIIYKGSRMADHFGIHLAFPYTDLDLYNFIQHLPLKLRANGSVLDCVKGRGVSKFIHKQLIKPKLPEAVINRPKQGGFCPLELFFSDPVRRRRIYNYLKKSAFAGILKRNDFLDAFFNQFENLITGKPYWFWYRQVKANQMFSLLIIALWWDRVMERRKMDTLSDYLSV